MSDIQLAHELHKSADPKCAAHAQSRVQLSETPLPQIGTVGALHPLMKKTITKRLLLTREVVRQLDVLELSQIAGGQEPRTEVGCVSNGQSNTGRSK